MHGCGRVFHMLTDGARTELETWRIALSRLDEKQPHCQELPFVYDKSRPILNTDGLTRVFILLAIWLSSSPNYPTSQLACPF
jgi:hypothetical protein